MSEDRCVICGETVPEGRMVCPDCEKRAEKERDLAEDLVSKWARGELVERKKGKWEGKKVFDGPFISQWQTARCSACGKHHATPFSYYFFDYKYCPYCGADMREEETDGKIC